MAAGGRAGQERRDGDRGGAQGPPIPGLVIVWSGEAPTLKPLRLPSLGLILGRELLGPRTTDDRISRQHARVRWNGTSFSVTDLGSRNGTYVGGSLVSENEVTVTPPCVLRTGRTVSVLVADVRGYEDGDVTEGVDGVIGPRRAAVHEALRQVAAATDAVLLVAEPGAGVDAAVSVFHATAGGGPLVEVEGGALAGAGGIRWWVGHDGRTPEAVRAHGGTLVIHDLDALDGDGQAAVAGILGTGELRSRSGTWPVDARVVAVCGPDQVEPLRAQVTAGHFRDDLWRRLLPHRVDLPPLRACCEEIPHWVVSRTRELTPDLSIHSTMIEACLLRPWPGNIDELRHEVACATTLARQGGKRTVRAEHLDADAGMLIALQGTPTVAGSMFETARHSRSRFKVVLDLDGVRAALVAADGDLARTAIGLGVHRNRLRRFIAEHDELAPLVSGDEPYQTAMLSEGD
ncbi:MAG: FHA domain-containing protein [Kofleriaceae bacterium]|nr:FHA domain-containing protein [Myxococcales bacterium]MCB9559943.1 FHA domain-containing protein [Kofleriaceae bacterium]